MTQKIAVASVLLTACLFTGCKHRLYDMTIMSSKNVDLSRSEDFVRGRMRVEGDDTKHIVFIVPTGVPSVKEAVDRAIEKVPDCVALVDVVVYSYGWCIPFIYGQSANIVEGLPLIDKGSSKRTYSVTSAPAVIQ